MKITKGHQWSDVFLCPSRERQQKIVAEEVESERRKWRKLQERGIYPRLGQQRLIRQPLYCCRHCGNQFRQIIQMPGGSKMPSLGGNLISDIKCYIDEPKPFSLRSGA